MSEPKKVRKSGDRLTHSQYRQLCDWLRRYEVELVHQRPNNVQTAERAAKELEFDIAPSSVAEAKKDVNISWPIPGQTSGKSHSVPMRTLVILRVVCSTLIKLHEDLGQPVPPRLTAVSRSLNAGRANLSPEDAAELDAARAEAEG